MAFNGTESKSIDQKMAAEWTRNYRKAQPDEPQSRFIGREVLLAILGQQDCQGIRLYYGLADSKPQLIAVGVDAKENDQLDGTAIVADDMPTGPPYSGQANALNS